MARRLRWRIEEMPQWARWGHLEERLPDFLRPEDLRWPESAEDLEACRRHLEPLLPGEEAHLPWQAVTAALLIHRETAPAWVSTWLTGRVQPSEAGLPLEWEEILGMTWSLVVFPVASGDWAELQRGLIGRHCRRKGLPPYPSWSPDVLDGEAVASVRQALGLLEGRFESGFFFWPLVRHRHVPRLKGNSLALPLYLAGWGVCVGVPAGPVIATGGLDGGGGVLPVGALDAKAAAAARHGFRALIHPAASRPPLETPPGLELIPVEDLPQAEFHWELCATGSGRDHHYGYLSLQSHERLAANVHLLPRPIFSWSRFDSVYDSLAACILDDRSAAERFIDNLEKMQARPDCCMDTLTVLLEPLSVDRILAMPRERSLQAFRLAQVQLVHANHGGFPERASVWSKVCDGLKPGVMEYEEGLNLVADSENRKFIELRHNRYDFRPSLTEELQGMLENLEALYRFRKACTPGATLPSLGKLYGTIAQNYGFCGPNFYPEFKEAAARAQEVFGRGEVPAYREDWRRQFAYWCYAALDAGKAEEARSALESYLGAAPDALDETAMESLNPYQHAVLARYLADTGETLPAYTRWAFRLVAGCPKGHPWQLWLYDMGRLLPEPPDRVEALKRSVASCLRQGPTAQVMALLPLERLRETGEVSEEWLREQVRGVLERLEGSSLNAGHFRRLLRCASWGEVLDEVAAGKGSLFPFSYR